MTLHPARFFGKLRNLEVNFDPFRYVIRVGFRGVGQLHDLVSSGDGRKGPFVRPTCARRPLVLSITMRSFDNRRNVLFPLCPTVTSRRIRWQDQAETTLAAKTKPRAQPEIDVFTSNFWIIHKYLFFLTFRWISGQIINVAAPYCHYEYRNYPTKQRIVASASKDRFC